MNQPMSSPDPTADAPPPVLRRSLLRLGMATGTLTVAALAAALVWGGTQLLSARAAARPAASPAPPVTVRAAPVVLQQQYEVTVAFTGRIEASR
ncbi:MAG: hypothetical protein ACK51Z_19975, partial [Pseudomonadota bacterium]